MSEPGSGAAGGRSRAKRIAVAALVLAIAGTIVVAADLFFHLRPIAAEALWRAALGSPVAALQQESIRRLRSHATRAAALSLVEFINAQSRAGDLEPAVRAAETLCVLSGRSFGSWFNQCSAGREWARRAGEEWPGILERINAWKASTFGTDS